MNYFLLFIVQFVNNLVCALQSRQWQWQNGKLWFPSTLQPLYMQFEFMCVYIYIYRYIYINSTIIWKLCNFITSGRSAPDLLLLSCFFFIDLILLPPICSNKMMFISSRRKLKPCFMSCRYANCCAHAAEGCAAGPPIWNPNCVEVTYVALREQKKKRNKKNPTLRY